MFGIKKLKMRIDNQNVVINKLFDVLNKHEELITSLINENENFKKENESFKKSQENLKEDIANNTKEQYNKVVLELNSLKEEISNINKDDNQQSFYEQMRKELWEDYSQKRD